MVPVQHTKKPRLTVVVLGDIGRSPRMQFHALSWLHHGFPVRVIGLKGEPPSPELLPFSVEIEDIRIPGPWLVTAPLRAVVNALVLGKELIICREKTDIILVQNPPSIPTLAVCLLASTLLRANLVIDWHNLGFKMLEHNKKSRLLVKIAQLYEHICAKLASSHLCVTSSLANWLYSNFHISAHVLYDRPHAEFQRIDSEHRTKIRKDFMKMENTSSALLVSATSWTLDEDFSLLLKGLAQYAVNSEGPNVELIITGKGPLKHKFEIEEIRIFNQKYGTRVYVSTAWLTRKDYSLLLGSADLGVSMHTSTSGLDLPMKILDYFGAGLPVLAFDFQCLGELVKDSNGRIFSTSNEFADQLEAILKGFPYNADELSQLKTTCQKGLTRWDENWDLNALPVFLSVQKGSTAMRWFNLIVLVLIFVVLLAVIGYCIIY